MTPEDFALSFEQKGGKLWQEMGRLKYGGPASLVTDKVRNYIRAHKDRLLQIADPFGFCPGCEGERTWRWVPWNWTVCMKCHPPTGLPPTEVELSGLFE